MKDKLIKMVTTINQIEVVMTSERSKEKVEQGKKNFFLIVVKKKCQILIKDKTLYSETYKFQKFANYNVCSISMSSNVAALFS